jgi:2-polyprenyl-3-methyl-5-hydroxy-6-metoxy-1,4-benzoquinol methylase/GNAT superfamily N-acetyltransferase
MEIKYLFQAGGLVDNSLLAECSNLYSEHYGVWSTHHPKSPGKKIQLSPERIKKLLNAEDADIFKARLDGELIGYAIAIRKTIRYFGKIALVTQLVVHEKYRQQDVAKKLLYSIWQLSDFKAWGIITPNPYAVRALERATHRRCIPSKIKKNEKKLLSICAEHGAYISKDTNSVITDDSSMVNTDFLVDHASLAEMVDSTSNSDTPWRLGSLEEGWEWFAFTFSKQTPFGWQEGELQELLEVADQVVKQAYSRMDIGENHRWAQHEDAEILRIITDCNLKPGSTVLDAGCGIGRHSLKLAENRMRVTGVDYIREFINTAKSHANKFQAKNVPQYVLGDCRDIDLGEQFDAAICLYDVIGSYVDNSENTKILKNIYKHLKPNGRVLFSVMNFELTEHIAKNKFSLGTEPDKLLSLNANNIMEDSGNIFEPDYFAIDTDTNIVYRKEQFIRGNSLPAELIVRDKRFARKEIERMCVSVGLEVIWSRYVSAGKWNVPLSKHNNKAKEILLLCKKPK